jgi:hypothetical protein
MKLINAKVAVSTFGYTDIENYAPGHSVLSLSFSGFRALF